MIENPSGLSIRNERNDDHSMHADSNTTGRSSSSSSSFNDSANNDSAASHPPILKNEAVEEENRMHSDEIDTKTSIKIEPDVSQNHNGELDDSKPGDVENIEDIQAYLQTNGWESPKPVPENGQVKPRVEPPPGKPTKHTNQLEYLYSTVIKAIKKHTHAWPFMKPVDTIVLKIPVRFLLLLINLHSIFQDYFDVIKRPMDVGTIEQRIKHKYYINAKECLKVGFFLIKNICKQSVICFCIVAHQFCLVSRTLRNKPFCGFFFLR